MSLEYSRGHGRLTPGRFLVPGERRRIVDIAERRGITLPVAEAAYRHFAPDYPTLDLIHDDAAARADLFVLLLWDLDDDREIDPDDCTLCGGDGDEANMRPCGRCGAVPQ